MEERRRKEFNRYDVAKVSAIVDYLWWKLASFEDDIVIEEALVNYWLDRMLIMAEVKSSKAIDR